MEIIILVVVYMFIIISELLPLIKKRRTKEVWVYVGGLIVSFIILLLFSLEVKIPSPTTLIKSIVKIFIS